MFVKERFQLDSYTKKLLHDLEPNFGYDGFGEIIFYRTYSRWLGDRQENWADVVIRVIEGCMSIRKDWYIKNWISWNESFWQDYGRKMALSLHAMEWLAPGRGLWIMGTDFIYERGSMALQNCLSKETEIITDKGTFALGDLVGREINVLTKDKTWKKATVKSFGTQRLNRISLLPFYGKNHRLIYDVTPNHRWILANGKETTRIQPKDKVLVSPKLSFDLDKESQDYINGYVHGLIFADGSKHYTSISGTSYSMRLCGWKKDLLNVCKQSEYYYYDDKPNHTKGETIVNFHSYKMLKKLPNNNESLQYKKAFLDGWIKFDGHFEKSYKQSLDTSNSEAAEWVIKNSVIYGYIITGYSLDSEPTNFGKRTSPLHRFIFSEKDEIFKVEYILLTGREEEVFCVVEPETKTFTLAGGIPTGNCGSVDIGPKFEEDLAWLMDALMLGVGVGFCPERDDKLIIPKRHKRTYDFEIEDSREGWVEATKRLIYSLRTGTIRPKNHYHLIRKKGEPIKGFGGIASGPEPLIYLHEKIEELFQLYRDDKYYDSVQLKTDIANLIGCCVVAGNVRRSAELAQLSIKDPTFINLKCYEHPRYAYRSGWGWMSNNSVDLEDDEDFDQLGEIAKRVIERGEPGYKNLKNFPFGRIGKKVPVRLDEAKRLNPCFKLSAYFLTPNGIRQLKEINIGDKIWSETGWTTVTKKWSTGVNKVYKYKTTAGFFEGTENHIIVSQMAKMKVKDAVSLDIITGKYVKKERILPQAIMDGLLIGDGTVKDNQVFLTIGVDDGDYFNSEIKNLIWGTYSKGEVFQVETNLNVEDIPYTYLRKIPEKYLKAPRDVVFNFLRGIYSANGSICGGRITLKASSFDIIEQIQMMLNSVGIHSYYTTNKATVVEFNNGEYLCKQSYDLNITHDRSKFLESIGFIQKYKEEILREIIEKTKKASYKKDTYDIISVELISEEETFDITVDNVTHTLWTAGTNGHNCGESLLEGKSGGNEPGGELCNQAETLPTRCKDIKSWYKACEYATVYSSTISLLPTHSPGTNRIIARNRRITIGIIDYSGWKYEHGVHKVTKWLREGYDIVTITNQWTNGEAGVPEAIRKTTIKPGGTTPKLAGKTSGIGHPTFKYTLRRFNVAKSHPMVELLIKANVPYEESVTDQYSYVFGYPIIQGPADPAEKVSLWEQAMNVVLVQREWADNAVANTLYFKPKWVLKKIFKNSEELRHYVSDKFSEMNEFLRVMIKVNNGEEDIEASDYRIKVFYNDDDEIVEIKLYSYDPNHEENHIEPVLSAIAPVTKSVSILPHSPKGVYKQMPEEGITEEEYNHLKKIIKKIDWSQLKQSYGEDERYCQGDNCELPNQVT